MTVTISNDITTKDLFSDEDLVTLSKKFNSNIIHKQVTYTIEPVRSFNETKRQLHGFRKKEKD